MSSSMSLQAVSAFSCGSSPHSALNAFSHSKISMVSSPTLTCSRPILFAASASYGGTFKNECERLQVQKRLSCLQV